MKEKMPAKGRGGSAALPIDSMAYALLQAGGLIELVIQGRNLTESFSRLQRQHPEWDGSVRGAVQDLTWGALREYGRGDRILDELLHKPLPDNMRGVMLAALYRLSVRPEQAFSIVDQAVNAIACMAPGLRGLANAVLRNSVRQAEALSAMREQDPVAHYCHPEWWIRRLQSAYPDEWVAILAAGNTHPPMSLRVNDSRTTVEQVSQALKEAGVDFQRLENDALLLARPMPVAALPEFEKGWVSVQDAGAQWAARWLDVADGQYVLDACAAPGGKSAHILESAQVNLLSVEIDKGRAQRITENFQRLGLHGKIACSDVLNLDAWWDGRVFDRILADVPCSASGVVRRHPDIKWLRRNEDIAAFARQQKKILEALWRTLAPGGKMLYVTCSVFPEENGAQIAAFCARHANAVRLPLKGESEQQLLPNAGQDGFFYALLGKDA